MLQNYSEGFTFGDAAQQQGGTEQTDAEAAARRRRLAELLAGLSKNDSGSKSWAGTLANAWQGYMQGQQMKQNGVT